MIKIFIIGLLIYFLIEFNKNYKIKCQKWIGDLKQSPPNICKDCGYPSDCHGPYKGESWRHIFQENII